MVELNTILTFLFRAFSALFRARVCNAIILATKCATSGDELAPENV